MKKRPVDRFTMSANAHHPQIKSVRRLDVEDGILSIVLGGEKYSHVALLLSDTEWLAIVRDVAKFLSDEATTVVADINEYLSVTEKIVGANDATVE